MLYLKDLLSRRELPVWRMPAAYNVDGSGLYTLDELVASKPPIKAPSTLDREQWRELVLAQLKSGLEHERKHPTAAKYQLACPAGFVQGFEQAIDEVERRSALGEVVLANRREYITVLIADVYSADPLPE